MEQKNEVLKMKRKGIPAFASILIYVVSFVVCFSVLSTVVSVVFNIPKGIGIQSFGLVKLVLIQTTTFLSAFLPILLLFKFLDHRPFSDLGFSLKGRGKDILYGWLMAVMLYGIGFGLSLALGVVEVTGFQFAPLQLLGSFFLFMLVAVTEEMMMRGYILGRMLRTRMNKFLALFISSLLFASMHLMNPNVTFLSMLNLVLAGMLLGASFLYTRNLWFPISLHLFWNWIQGPVLGYEVSGNKFGLSLLNLRLTDNTLINGGAFGFEGSLICTVLMVVFAALIIWWFERKK